MPNCRVVGCGIKISENRPNITLHRFRLPKNYRKRNMWLNTIGIEKLKTHTKTIYIRSLHFEESYYNRTLNITTLRDDAVPLRIFLRKLLGV